MEFKQPDIIFCSEVSENKAGQSVVWWKEHALSLWGNAPAGNPWCKFAAVLEHVFMRISLKVCIYQSTTYQDLKESENKELNHVPSNV